jgi:uncharacterized protein YyaL (SSP411 family)
MSVWLTPDLKPIVGGTYFPPDDRYYGRPGFKSVLIALAEQVWYLLNLLSIRLQHFKSVIGLAEQVQCMVFAEFY